MYFYDHFNRNRRIHLTNIIPIKFIYNRDRQFFFRYEWINNLKNAHLDDREEKKIIKWKRQENYRKLKEKERK